MVPGDDRPSGRPNGRANGGAAAFTPPPQPPHAIAVADAVAVAAEARAARRGMLAAKAWYLWTYSAQAMLIPFMNLFFLGPAGLSQTQVGSLMALRPWTGALAGNLWALLADATQAHSTILLLTYAAIPFIRYGLTAVRGYGPTLALVLAMEAVGAPVNIIVDATTMAAGEDEGAYGRTRVWGAVGWGLFSPVGGWIVARYGLKAAFAANCSAWGAGVVLTALLPVSALSATHAGARAARAARRRAAADAADAARAEHRRANGRATPPPVAVPGGGAGAGAGDRAPLSPPRLHPASSAPDADAVSANLSSSLPLAIAPELQAYESDALLARRAAARKASAEEAAVAEGGEEGEGEGEGDPARRPLLRHEVGAAPAPPAPPLPPSPPSAAAAAAAAAALPIPAKLGRILANPAAPPFFATCVVFGFAMGTIDSWLFVFLQSLGAPPTLMGLTLTVTCAVEAPVFFFAGRLLAAIGVRAVLRLVYAAFLLRLSAYWALPLLGTPWAVLPVEALHGITFGCAWAAGQAQCARLAPPGLEATTQAVFTGLYMGVGLGLGGLVGGYVHAALGARAVFAVAAAVVAAAWAVISLAELALSGRRAAAWETVEAERVNGTVVASGGA